MKSSFLVTVLLALIFISCKKENGDSNNNPPVNQNNVDADLMLKLVNDVRQSGCNCGGTAMPPVPPVTWNALLAKAAYDHSADMKTKNYFSHTGVNGSTPGSRFTAAGYTWVTYAENISLGYTSETAVMNGWLTSEGHCLNIMNANYKEMGAGREGTYWTQAFGSR
jgi:uncharacterized protein YkwD